jgi:hypothetical protein
MYSLNVLTTTTAIIIMLLPFEEEREGVIEKG